MRNSAPRPAIWVRHILRLYPRAWRDRYGDEVAGVLREHPVTVWTALDMLLGAADAHLHRDLLPGRLQSMSHQTRSSLLVIFGAVVLFCVAWLPLRLVRDPLPIWRHATAMHPALLVTLNILDVGGTIAVLATLAGGGALVFTALRRAITTRQWRTTAIFCVPLLAGAAFVVYAILVVPASTMRQSSAIDAPFTPLAVVLQLSLVVLLLSVLGGSVLAITAALGQSEVHEGAIRFALLPAAVATGALLLGLIGASVLTVYIFAEAPQVSASPVLHGGDLLVMLTAVMLASMALHRSFRVARQGSPPA